MRIMIIGRMNFPVMRSNTFTNLSSRIYYQLNRVSNRRRKRRENKRIGNRLIRIN